MTVTRNASPTPPLSLLAIALVMVFAIAAGVLTRPDPAVQTLSPVAGLMTLKAAAQESMPYEEAIANPKPTLVEFYADWCTTCQAIAPTLQSVQGQFGERMNFVMLNIDDPQWRDPMQQFRVNGVPHLVLLNADQTVADTFIGHVPKSVLTNRVGDWLGADG